jgi:hypothetical protein
MTAVVSSVAAAAALPLAAAKSGNDGVPSGAASICLVIEAVLLGLLASGRINAWVFLGCHLAVVLALAAQARSLMQSGSNTTPLVVLAIAVASTGPLGALGALIGFLLPRRKPVPARLLRDWYKRIALSADVDNITRLCDDVSSGRHVGLHTPPPASFVAVLERGSLANRQAALGLMARHIHPEYLAALKSALQSSEPVIRVQAAAVATKIRPELRTLVNKAVSDLDGGKVEPGKAVQLAADLQACVDCGLLDAGDRIRADVIIPRLRALGSSAPLVVSASGVSRAGETMLLQQGRFRDLRVARRIASAVGPHGRVRRRASRQSAASLTTNNNRPSLQETQLPPVLQQLVDAERRAGQDQQGRIQS